MQPSKEDGKQFFFANVRRKLKVFLRICAEISKNWLIMASWIRFYNKNTVFSLKW